MSEQTPLMSNKVYDWLKFISTLGLPALGTLYFALSEIWGFPYGKEVIGTITAVDVFAGVLLGLGKRSYDNSDSKYDGELVVSENPVDEKTIVQMGFKEESIDNIQQKSEVVLKVQEGPPHIVPPEIAG